MAWLVPAISGDDSGASADELAVVSRATEFAVAYNTYDASKLEAYQQRVGGLLTADYRKVFDEVTSTAFPTLATKQQISQDPQVRSVAIDSIDQDSATALVAVDATVGTADGATSAVQYYRWTVKLTKVGQTWQVEEFAPVATTQAQAQTEGQSPAATPTPEATP